MTLAEQILAAAAFDERAWEDAIAEAQPRADKYMRLQRDAVRDENARLQPLLTALASVASAAEAHTERCEFSGHSLEALNDALERLRAQIGGRDD